MATPKIDSNMWYQLYVGDGTQSVVGPNRFNSSASTGPIYFVQTNTSRAGQQWQIFQLNSTTWTLRNAEGGPNAWMGAAYSKDEATDGLTRPIIARGDVADASVYWNINAWGDGTWYLNNAANGTGYRLDKHQDNNLMYMSPNLTAPQNNQRWVFKNITAINDEQYSTINLVGAVTTARPSSPSSADNNANKSSSSPGLSRGAQAAIGASIGGVALIAIVLLGLVLWRRRKSQPAYSNSPKDLTYETDHTPLTVYKMYQGDATRSEAPDSGVVEAPSNERPVELPGHAVER